MCIPHDTTPHLGWSSCKCERYWSICSDSLCSSTIPLKRFATIRNSVQSRLAQSAIWNRLLHISQTKRNGAVSARFETLNETFLGIMKFSNSVIILYLLFCYIRYTAIFYQWTNNIFVKKYYGCHDYAAYTILYVRQDSSKCSNAVELYFTWCGIIRCIHVVILY